MADVIREDRTVSPVAQTGVVLAGSLMIVLGVFQALQGLVALIDDDMFVVLPNYTFSLDITGWGWIHLVVGIAIAVTGVFLLSRSAIAGGVAIGLAAISAVANFLFIPFYPLWSMLVVALAVFVIWAIARSGIFDT
ncbi:DUF7144 family membrane protein [Puerhibacterium puerhi]|uniref:DUF7144 family membrane protein n=1 Tax=Puerhibacterium puerhi TaxID=2692623 RepID=UPI00135914E7|nr:hypothetical protein [Puerhibacterium puerhi]